MSSMVSEDRIFGDLIVTYSKYNKLKVIYKNYEYMVASTTAKHIWLRCTCEKLHKCPARGGPVLLVNTLCKGVVVLIIVYHPKTQKYMCTFRINDLNLLDSNISVSGHI